MAPRRRPISKRTATLRETAPTIVRLRRAGALIGLAALILIGLTVASRAVELSSPRAPTLAPGAPMLELRAGPRTLARIPVRRYVNEGRIDSQRLQQLVEASLPGRWTSVRAAARITYRADAARTIARVARTGTAGGIVQAAGLPVASAIRAPVLAQKLRNNCESAALEVLIATMGRRVDQLVLQRALPRSGPLDPVGVGAGRVWGDPELGYVGRADGGGAAGGFGVYPAPVRRTAARFGAATHILGNRSPNAVYDQLLAGHAVMAWVGLSAGPYGQWRSPRGRSVKVNFGEHTVVLHGVRPDGRLLVSNPLEGTRETWTRSTFELMWRRLGRRALAA